MSFMKDSRDFLEHQWYQVRSWFGHDEAKINTWGLYWLAICTYWGFGILYSFVDITGRPNFLRKYRIQNIASYPVSWRRMARVVSVVVLNQILMLPLFFLFHQLHVWRGSEFGPSLPSLLRVILDIITCVIVEEVAFYYSHRLLHHPYLYKRIHKIHHEWTSPVAVTAIYCHPIEHYFSNVIPVALGPVFVGCHTTTVLLWNLIAIYTTMYSHSGYYFPYDKLATFHDLHHLKTKCNYGVLGIMDYIHGTTTPRRRKIE